MGSISTTKGGLVFNRAQGIQSCPKIKHFQMDLNWAGNLW
jgi:hypothetical protein